MISKKIRERKLWISLDDPSCLRCNKLKTTCRFHQFRIRSCDHQNHHVIESTTWLVLSTCRNNWFVMNKILLKALTSMNLIKLESWIQPWLWSRKRQEIIWPQQLQMTPVDLSQQSLLVSMFDRIWPDNNFGFKFTKVLDGRTPCRILFTPDRKMFRSDQIQISRTRWKKGNYGNPLVSQGPDGLTRWMDRNIVAFKFNAILNFSHLETIDQCCYFTRKCEKTFWPSSFYCW